VQSLVPASGHRAIELIFAAPGHDALLAALDGEGSAPEVGDCTFARFANGELHLRLHTHPGGRVCAALGSLAPPDAQLLELLLLADTLRRHGASRLVALLPYLGYARQDRAEPCQSLGAAWTGALLGAVGVERVVTVDVHSSLAAGLFPMPVLSVSPAPLFARELARRGLRDATIVAPDEGALARCEAVARAADITAPVSHLRKHRDARGVTHGELVGAVAPRVVLIDDILDTGGTLVSACHVLRSAGARQITVMVTHGLFSGERWRELYALGVEQIYTTDSVPAVLVRKEAHIGLLPLGQLIIDALARGDRQLG